MFLLQRWCSSTGYLVIICAGWLFTWAQAVESAFSYPGRPAVWLLFGCHLVTTGSIFGGLLKCCWHLIANELVPSHISWSLCNRWYRTRYLSAISCHSFTWIKVVCVPGCEQWTQSGWGCILDTYGLTLIPFPSDFISSFYLQILGSFIQRCLGRQSNT